MGGLDNIHRNGIFFIRRPRKVFKKEKSDFATINYETRAARSRLTATGNKSQSGQKMLGLIDINIKSLNCHQHP